MRSTSGNISDADGAFDQLLQRYQQRLQVAPARGDVDATLMALIGQKMALRSRLLSKLYRANRGEGSGSRLNLVALSSLQARADELERELESHLEQFLDEG